MSAPTAFDAENAENMEDIEKQFAVKAVEQMATYWGLLEAIPGSKLKLTPFDQEIYDELIVSFPEFEDPQKVAVVSEDEFKSKEGKERWRNYMKKFEKKVEDYNFGTLLRLDSSDEYSEDNTMFAVRIQFYAIEIARNKYGLNDWACKK